MFDTTDAIQLVNAFCHLADVTERSSFYDGTAPLCDASDEGRIPFCELDTGCTKGVFIFADADFVLKVPFREYWGRYFRNVGAASSSWDYCAKEVEVYAAAVEAGVEQFLAKTEKIGEVDGTPIYAQERLAQIGSYGFSESRVTNKTIKQANRLFHFGTLSRAGFYPMLIECMIAEYGYRATHRFMKFIITQNVGCDWHCGNFGERLDGTICLCDYSGFRDG